MAATACKCPKCQALLNLPGGIGQAKVRCPACRHVFRVRISPKPSLEDTIAAWLHDDGREEAVEPDQAPPPGQPLPLTAAGPTSEEELEIAAELPAAGRRDIRLVSIERRGALFEFSTDCLESEAFRCAIPRACVHCLARHHLTAHLIIFGPQLRDSISLEGERRTTQLRIPQDEVAGAEGPAMLRLLPKVPDVPDPGNLPMPYWVCELCRGRGWIAGQIKVNPETGQGICRLRIRSLNLALGFFAKAGGKTGADYQRLQDFIEHMEENLWDALPSVVRHRVEQWFRPRIGERFLAYVPDRAFARSEDGMNGLAVSTHRLVYHHPPLHQESVRQNELTIQVRPAKGNEVAAIEAAHFKRRSIALDRGGMMILRQALSQGNFRASWR